MKLLSHTRKRVLAISLWLLAVGAIAQRPFGNGQLTVQNVARNAVRVQYVKGSQQNSNLPDWLYVKNEIVQSQNVKVSLYGKGIEGRGALGLF